MRRCTRALVSAMFLPLAACADEGPSGLAVARAAGHELTVGEVARLIAPESNLPAQRQVVEAVADLWIDYTLLAEAAAGDSAFSGVDFDPLVRQQAESRMLMVLRDSLVVADTTVSEQEVRERFSREAPGSRVRASHILLAWPDGATQEQRDSVRAQAEALLARIEAGEDFSALASEYSDDPGSAAQGGDLGFFGRGDMVQAFEEAAFALEPGETSGVVESPYGYHIIRVVEKETPSFEELGPRFRESLVQERQFKAESTYVAGIEERASPSVTEDAIAVVRQLAREPNTRLSGRAAERELVEYRGGALTAGEVRAFMQTRPPQYRAQVSDASDEQIQGGILMALAQRELLLAEAEAAGLGLPEAARDSIVSRARVAFQNAARQLGLLGIEPAPEATMDETIEMRVEALLQAILQGRQNVIPLGAVSYTLRRQYEAQTFPAAIERALLQVEEVRGPASGQEPTMPPPTAPPAASPEAPPGGATPPADSAGSGA